MHLQRFWSARPHHASTVGRLQGEAADARRQGAHGDLSLQPRQWRSHAIVNAHPKGDVAVRRAIQDKLIGIREHTIVAIRRAEQDDDTLARRDSRARDIDIAGRAPDRGREGGVARSASSIAAGTSSGSRRTRSYTSGNSENARTALTMRPVVVSLPATSSSRQNIKSSSCELPVFSFHLHQLGQEILLRLPAELLEPLLEVRVEHGSSP